MAPTLRRWAGAGGLVTVVTMALVATVTNAEAATVFTADFESGSTSGWSRSGGTWSVAADGSQTLRQTNASSENARQFAGDAAWTDYTVSAKVKPLSFGANGFVGLLARAKSSTTFYRLALLPGNQAQLQAVNSGNVTVLGSAARTVATGSWYTLSLTVSGTTISGSVDGTAVGSGTSSVAGTGRIGLQTGYASAGFDDVTVSTGGTTPPTSSPPTSGSPSASPSPSPSTSTPPPVSGALYVAPNGSASAAGTQAAPTTLPSAITRIAAGGTIYLRGGTYNSASTITVAPGNNGSAGALKKIVAYPGERPILNFSAQAEDPAARGLAVNGNYWHVQGLIVERAGDNGIFIGGSNNIVERTVTRFNRDSGLQISRIASDTPNSQWPANNLVLSSESHDNADSDGEDADGFAAKLTVGSGNVFRYTVSHHNIDDGWDLYTKTDTGPIGVVTIEDSLAYENGTLSNGGQAGAGDRNGYKLGGEDIGVNHVVRRSIAYDNGKHGFTYNSNPGSMTISNNLSIDNAERNFNFDEGSHVFRNNTSCRSGSGTNDRIIGNSDSSNQFWSGSNGSRCASYTGALGWSFAADGKLVVTLGGRVVSL
ncbi:family 16 glycoside hydrolase [Actinoplanes aureus]|uniref:Right-handed parallel beta-helix repeat-containing protein n=1 Tax=Actinoplanes aureus TaxID=2792083 RepID=A0A931CB66_9ACTN|nr:family 16 glycoside hydrolase [Actinoplanes aureus]MBG0564187.1 right-handed parallel beta-helix repeat-containing protein [Actinoplanes aureus]